MNWFRRRLGRKVAVLTSVVVVLTSLAHFVMMRIGNGMSLWWHLALIVSLIVAGWFVAWSLTSFLTQDLNRIIVAADRLAMGEPISHTGVRSTDQVGELARAFERMAESLQEQARLIRHERDLSDERRSRLEAILNTAGDGIITVYREPSGSVVRSFNRRACEMFGVKPEDVEEKPYRDVVQPALTDRDGRTLNRDEDFDWLATMLDRLSTEHPYEQVELGVRRIDGTWFPVVVSVGQAQVLKSKNEQPRSIPLVTLIIRDVSEAKMQEAQLREQNEQLVRLNSELRQARENTERGMRAQEVFMANLSHDLRTPLTVVLGYAEELLDQSLLNEQVATEDLQLVVTASKDLMELINDSSNFFKLRHGGKLSVDRKKFSPRWLIEKHRSTIKFLAAKRENQFVETGLDTVGEIVTDRYFLWRAVMNLLSNACKFTEKGKVELIVERRTEGGEDWILFRVRDDGVGIPSHVVSSLFTRYQDAEWSGSRGRTGLGIGLHICKMYAELLGGTVAVERTATQGQDRGSTFLLRIPAVLVPPTQAWTTPPPASTTEAEPTPDVKRSVLVIEDDRHVSDRLVDSLNALGYTAQVATNGLDGLRVARQFHPTAIILDILLPEFDGWGVLAALKNDHRTQDIPVLMVTVVDDTQKAAVLGADEYLIKPFTKAAVTRAIQRMLSGPGSGGVLVVGPRETTEYLRSVLGSSADGFQLVYANTFDDARTLIVDAPPDVLLLDPRLPDAGGEAIADWADLPTILWRDTESPEDRNQYNMTVIGYLTRRGVDRTNLLDLIRRHLNRLDRRSLPPVAGVTP
jgi:PAS domain S-box-containing protein